jgi:hypothetical protein
VRRGDIVRIERDEAPEQHFRGPRLRPLAQLIEQGERPQMPRRQLQYVERQPFRCAKRFVGKGTERRFDQRFEMAHRRRCGQRLQGGATTAHAAKAAAAGTELRVHPTAPLLTMRRASALPMIDSGTRRPVSEPEIGRGFAAS